VSDSIPTAQYTPGDRVLEMATVAGRPGTVISVELAADGTPEYWVRLDDDDPSGIDDWPCNGDELRPMPRENPSV
jgi:hypothetical protein